MRLRNREILKEMHSENFSTIDLHKNRLFLSVFEDSVVFSIRSCESFLWRTQKPMSGNSI